MLKKEQPKRTLPYVADPDVQQIIGQPDNVWELLNRYGTYEVQATQDTDNPYPSIAQGYPHNPGADPSNPWKPAASHRSPLRREQ